MLEEYNHYIMYRADKLPIIKISYKINNVSKDASMRIERNNQPLTLTVYEKFVLKKLGFSEWIEVHALASKNNTKANNILLKNLKANSEIIQEVFVKENIIVDRMQRNLIPLPGSKNAIQRGSLEAKEMFTKMEPAIEARNDVTKARKVIKDNLDGLGQHISTEYKTQRYLRLAECKASAISEELAEGKASASSEGLAECKASARNLKRIKVKDIVKEVEDHLKTYSSPGMDISWLGGKLNNVLWRDKRLFELKPVPIGYKSIERDRLMVIEVMVAMDISLCSHFSDNENDGLGCVLMQRGKVENATAEMLRGLDQLMERKEGGGMYLLWVPLIGDVRTLMMDEAHASRYLVHSGADKTYYDLRDMYGGHVWRRILLPIYHSGVDVLYGRKCKSHVLWAEIGEIRIEVGDKVMLEVSSWKDVVHFGKKEMLAPRYVGPFKYLADTNLHENFKEIKVDKTLFFVEEPVEIINRKVKSLKRSRIPIVKSIGTRSEVKRIS
ncbi:hypothetical protein Tco_0601897 [Tanacetum coccineum]